MKFASEYRDAENKAAADIVTKDWTSALRGFGTILTWTQKTGVHAPGCTVAYQTGTTYQPRRPSAVAYTEGHRGYVRACCWCLELTVLLFGRECVCSLTRLFNPQLVGIYASPHCELASQVCITARYWSQPRHGCLFVRASVFFLNTRLSGGFFILVCREPSGRRFQSASRRPVCWSCIKRQRQCNERYCWKI